MRDLPPQKLLEHRNALVAFHNAYGEYIAAVEENGHRSDAEKMRLRNVVMERMLAAQKALNLVGGGVAFTPPPAFAGRMPVMHGLENTAFFARGAGMAASAARWDQADIRDGSGEPAGRRSCTGGGSRGASRRRRNPLYWIDRGLRAVLGRPAYLLSLLIPVSFEDIDRSWFGTLLKLVQLVGVGFGIYFGGAQQGWW